MKTLLNRSSSVALVLGLLILASSPALQAQDQDLRGFWAYVEGFLPLDLESSFTISSGDAEIGTSIDIEGELDLDDAIDRARFRGGFRFGRRHEIEVSYLSVARRNGKILARNLQVGRFEFAAGFELQTQLKTEDVELGYNYYFLQRERGEMGFSLGVHTILNEVTVDGTAFIAPTTGLPRAEFAAVESESVSIPLPYLGLHGKVELGRKFVFSGLVKVFELSIQDYSGSWTSVEAKIEHHTFEHVGFGLGFFLSDLDVQADLARGVVLADFSQEQNGIAVFVRFNR